MRLGLAGEALVVGAQRAGERGERRALFGQPGLHRPHLFGDADPGGLQARDVANEVLTGGARRVARLPGRGG